MFHAAQAEGWDILIGISPLVHDVGESGFSRADVIDFVDNISAVKSPF